MRGRGWVGHVLREGKRGDGRWVRMCYETQQEGERLAVVAGREVGGAVVRNRVRRRVREAWRRVGGMGRMEGRVVIRVRKGGGEAEYGALEEDLEGVLRRIEEG